MKKLLIFSVVLNVILLGMLLAVWGMGKWSEYQSTMYQKRLESVFRMSSAIHSGELDTEDWDNIYTYLDDSGAVYDFDKRDGRWSCSIGPLHPTYGPWIHFDSEGALRIESEKQHFSQDVDE